MTLERVRGHVRFMAGGPSIFDFITVVGAAALAVWSFLIWWWIR